MMRFHGVFMSQLISPFVIQLLNSKRFFLNILLQLVHFERLFAQNTNQWIICIRIEKNFQKIMIFFSSYFHLTLTFHSFRIPKSQQCLSLTIFISNRCNVLGVTSSRIGHTYPGIKVKVSSVFQPFLFSRSVQLIVKNAWLFLRFETQCHSFFVIADSHRTDLVATFSTRVIRLRFLFLSRIVNHPMVPRKIKDSIG